MKTRLEVTIDQNARCNTVLTNEIVAILYTVDPTVNASWTIQRAVMNQHLDDTTRKVLGATMRAALENMKPKTTALLIGDERPAGPWG